MKKTFGVLVRAPFIALVLAFVSVQPSAAGVLAISWVDTAVDEAGFFVERRPQAGGVFQQIAVQGRNVVTYLDASVPSGAHCYRVRAFNAAGTSNYTNESCGAAAAAALPPLSVTLNAVTFRQSDTMVATVHARSDLAQAVDAYVVVQTGGGYLSLQLDGSLVPGLVPMARNIVLPTVDAPFAFPLAGAPAGNYTWMAAVTTPGTLSMVVPIVTTAFTIN